MRDLYLISPALFPKTIHCTQLYGCSLRMDSSHLDVVSRLPLVETPPSATVRSRPYPSTIVVPALATDSSPLTSPSPRGSNGSTTARTMASRTLDVPERESPRPWQPRQPQQHEKTRQEKFRQPQQQERTRQEKFKQHQNPPPTQKWLPAPPAEGEAPPEISRQATTKLYH